MQDTNNWAYNLNDWAYNFNNYAYILNTDSPAFSAVSINVFNTSV
jgi:hypothetical protein